LIRRNFTEDRRICEAASLGPWKVYGGKFGETNIHADNGIVARDIDWDKDSDARFIAEARTGWPAALDEIERLRNALSRITEHDGLYYLSSQHAMGSCLRIAKEALEYGSQQNE